MNLAALTQDLSAFAQVLVIDVALAGDNAVVVGMAVAGLPPRQQRPAIILGIGGATLIRIGFGAIALRLLEILGLLLAGGMLLLWVCWKMYRELRHRAHADAPGAAPRKTLLQAMTQIVLADVSMSLDNVLAVAGASGGSTWVLAAGLTISVVLMGIAAGVLARILERQRWIAWIGLLIVLSVAVHMIWQGARAVAGAV
jgi:YjbE family integral membrane protein